MKSQVFYVVWTIFTFLWKEEASCKPEKGGKEKGDAIVKSTSSNVTKILAGGGFGSVPVEGSRGDATKTSKSKATQNMSVKIKEKPQSQAQSNSESNII